ncbi:MAG: hypothetical protein OEZ34_06030 [Spirochaetia bacterium]|nr:hypothetical protein [Spirochaetia bacterium]
MNLPVQFVQLDGTTDWIALIIKSMHLTFFLPVIYFGIHNSVKRLIPKKEIIFTRDAPFKLILVFLIFEIFLYFFYGPALPGLEDEMAYYLQSLLFSEGILKGKFSGIHELMAIPYIFYDGDSYFSAHQHGFSYLITLIKLTGLAHFINIAFASVNSYLIYHLSRRLNLSEHASILVQTAYLTAPLTLYLTRSYMSHHFAQFLLFVMAISWINLYSDRSKIHIINKKFILHSFIFTAAGLILSLTRIQIFAVILASLSFAELLYVSKFIKNNGLKKIQSLSVAGALNLAILILFSILTLKLYASLYSMDSLIFLQDYMTEFAIPGCQSLGWGQGKGCFATYGTMGHTFLKTFLNMISFVFSYNNILSPVFFPLLTAGIYILIKEKKNIFNTDPFYLILMIPLMQLMLHGLYFHNGSENYFGRYIYESSPFLFILFAKGAESYFIKKRGAIRIYRHSLIAGMIIAVLTGIFSVYGNFNSYKPVTSELRKIQNSLILIKVDESDLISPDEYNDNQNFSMPYKKSRYIINDEYAEVMTVILHKYSKGYFSDQNGNFYFPSNISAEKASDLQKKLDLKQMHTFQITTPEFYRVNKHLKIQDSRNLEKYDDPAFQNLQGGK